MNLTISNQNWVECSLGDMKLVGFVEEGGDGIYWFNTVERFIEGRASLMVSETDIRLLDLEIYEEDIESMIDLALQARDKEWFIELIAKLEIMRMTFPEFLNKLDGDAIEADWNAVGKSKFRNGLND